VKKKPTARQLHDRARYRKGSVLARQAIARRAAVPLAVTAASKGLLLAEGDSWFDYPFFDLLEMLEADGYEIESVAHRGDNLEDMAHDEQQVDRLARSFARVRQRGLDPKAVLLSGGGNDIAGAEFPVLVNHANSGLPVLNERVVAGLIDDRLRPAMASLIGTVTTFCRNFFGATKPILVHGYDYPIPDARGYLGGGWILPGPWLEPGFRKKGHYARSASQQARQLAANARVMRELIDRYSTMLRSVAAGFSHVRFIDLRGVLSSNLKSNAYRQDWGDELHPTKSGFRTLAKEFEKAL
jgi:hypothetical protein